MSEAGRIVVLGGTGQLGIALDRGLTDTGRRGLAPSRAEFDLRVPSELERKLAALSPSAVINAAAYNDVAGAEREENRGEAFLVNRDGPAELARACDRLGILLVHVSTDFVFDGRKRSPYREDDPTGPLQWYGRSKLEGELAVLEASARALVVRTSTLFGPSPRGSGNYVAGVLRHARDSGRVDTVRAPVSAPTHAPDLAVALISLMDSGAAGIVHAVNGGSCSRLDLAREAVRLAGLDVEVAERPESFARPPRPAYSVLDTTRLADLTGGAMRSWQEALGDYVAML